MNKHLINLLLAFGFTPHCHYSLFHRSPYTQPPSATNHSGPLLRCPNNLHCIPPEKEHYIACLRLHVNGKTYQTSNNGILQTTNRHCFDQWTVNRANEVVYLPAYPNKKHNIQLAVIAGVQ